MRDSFQKLIRGGHWESLSVGKFQVAILMMLAFSGGCEQEADVVAGVRQTSWAESQDLSQTRLKFEWPLDARQILKIEQPPIFSFLEGLNLADLGKHRPEPIALDLNKFSPHLRPLIAKCNTDKADELKTLLTVEPVDVAGPNSFALSRMGTGLVTLGEAIKIWDVSGGKQRGEAFALPAPQARTLLLSHKERHVIVADDEKFYRLSLADGSIVKTIDAPGGFVRSWVRSTLSNVIAGVTERGQLFTMRDDLTELVVHEYDLSGVNVRLAISPRATDVVLAIGGTCRYVELDGTKAKAEYTIDGALGSDSVVASGNNFALWADSDHVGLAPLSDHLRRGLEEGGVSSLEDPVRLYWKYLHWNLVKAELATLESGDWAWFVVIAERPAADGNVDYVFLELDPSTGNHGVPRTIDGSRPLAFRVSNAGQRAAVLQKERLRVMQCGPRTTRTGDLAETLAMTFINNGELRQYEALAEYILRGNEWAFGASPDDRYLSLVCKAGDAWSSLQISHDETPDKEKQQTLDKLDAWLTEGSVHAALVSAFRWNRLAWHARGNSQRGQFSQTGYQTFMQRIQSSSKDLDAVLQMEHPPASAFHFKNVCQWRLQADVDLFEEMLSRSVTLYPDFFIMHRGMALRLMPNYGEALFAPQWYAYSIANLFPGDEGDAAYANILMGIVDSYNLERSFQLFAIDRPRFANGARARLKQGCVDSAEIQRMAAVCMFMGYREVATELMAYHQKHLPMVAGANLTPTNYEAVLKYTAQPDSQPDSTSGTED